MNEQSAIKVKISRRQVNNSKEKVLFIKKPSQKNQNEDNFAINEQNNSYDDGEQLTKES